MVENILLAVSLSLVCISIQCVVVALQLRLLTRLERNRQFTFTVIRASCLLAVVMLIMLTANILQISIWAGVFVSIGEFENIGEAFYHSAVNFTTLGYGDIVMSPQRRVLGALEAANGVLMFGLTTSLLFALAQVLIRRGWAELSDHEP